MTVDSNSVLLLASEDPFVQRSLLSWEFSSMGLYGFVIPFLAFVIFVGACAVVLAARRPAVIAAYLVVLPLPLLIGIFGSLHGFINALQVIAQASAAPKPSEIAEGVSTGLFTTLVALLLSFPAYFVVAGGLVVRTLLDKTPLNARPPKADL